MNFIGIEFNMRLKETDLGAYGFWKLLFIIFFVMSRAFAENGSLNPLFAIWLPNLIFGVFDLIRLQNRLLLLYD